MDAQICLYVSPNGSDQSGNGSVISPYATIQTAKEHLRRILKEHPLTEDAYIFLRGGTYYLKQAIWIEAADCDPNYRIHYTAYPEETVRLVGGVLLTGWSAPDEKGICYTRLPKDTDFYTMFDNGKRLQPARESDWQKKSVTDLSHLQAVYGSETSWFGEVLKVNSLQDDRIITDIQPCDWNGGLQYLQGAKEYITQEGEWAIADDRVYYKPFADTDLAEHEIVAGTVPNVFRLEGTPEHPVQNIVIEGLQLEMNAFGANLAAQARPHNVLAEYDENLQGLVYLHHVKQVTVSHCRMKNAGYVAVSLHGLAQNNVVYGNDIIHTGYAGIFLIGENPGSLNYCNHHNRICNNRIHAVGSFVGHGAGIYLINSGENTVTHNDISNVPRYGISMKGMRYGVFPDNGLDNVSFEEHWKYNQTTGNYFGYNRIYNTGIRSGDGGGIEGWGMGPYNHIDHNIIYNAYRGVATTGWRGHSIFLDDAAHHTKVTYNIIYDENAPSVNAGVFIKSIGNIVTNNVFDVGYAKDGGANIRPYICPAGNSVFARNIVYSHTPGSLSDDGSYEKDKNGSRIMFTISNRSNHTTPSAFASLDFMDHNLYYHAYGKAVIQVEERQYSLQEWQTCPENIRGYDAASICADPMFLNPDGRDYRLSADSPARKLGIESIEVRNIGLKEDFRYV